MPDPRTCAIPERFNIAADVCTRWAGSGKLALIQDEPDGTARFHTFDDLDRASNQAAHLFRALGIVQGSRVGLLLQQGVDVAICHLALYKLGAIAVPLSVLFGDDALDHRLNDSGAVMVVVDRAGAAKLAPMRHRIPTVATICCTDGATGAAIDLHARRRGCSEAFPAVETFAEDPALLIYTSGTTGKAKGVLHAHRVLLGHLPGVEASHGGPPVAEARFWTPADWSWIGGLLNILLSAWHYGAAVVARRFDKFDPFAAVDLIRRHRVTNVFLPPTALKLIRSEVPTARLGRLHLRSLASGGESLGSGLSEWGARVLGVPIAEFYGQTECNLVISSSPHLFVTPPDWMGKVVPGHHVAIVDDVGTVLPPGRFGSIAVRRPDPAMFLGYWANEAATAEKFRGDFMLTGDLGEMDPDGHVRFVARNDDVITSAGYRVGPGPIEDCLLAHPAVRMAAVVGVPDPLRTERIKAFVVLQDGVIGSDQLTAHLQGLVRTRLAAHEYPRDIEYVSALPMTSTGKVMRNELRTRARAQSPA